MHQENEIELKFELDDSLVTKIKETPAFEPLPATLVHDPIMNYYYDTLDLDLQKRGFALRLRQKKQQYIQSLKGGGYSDKALHSRQEWNSFIPDLIIQPALLIDTPVADLVSQGKIHAELKPLFVTAMARELWEIRWKNSILEVAIDRGFIVVGEHKQALNELEIELVTGHFEDIMNLATWLQTHWQLTPVLISKAAKGYAFLASLKDTYIPK